MEIRQQQENFLWEILGIYDYTQVICLFVTQMIGICQYVLFKIFLTLGLEVSEVSEKPNKIVFNHSLQSWQKMKQIYFYNNLKLVFPHD